MSQESASAEWLQQAAIKVLDQAPTEMALLDADGKIVHVNRAWLRFAADNDGDPTKIALGQDYLQACRLAGKDGGDALDAISSVLDGSREVAVVEYPCHSPTEQRWFRLRCIRVDAGPAVVAVMHDDLTDHYLANEARQRLRQEALRVKQLEREEQRTTQALNTIGHTLRTPLTPVRLQMATLARQELPGDVDVLAQKMRATTERLVDAVNEAIKAIELQQAPLRLIAMPAAEAGEQLHAALLEDDAMANVAWHLQAHGDVEIDIPLLAPPLAELLRTAKARDPEGHAELDVDLSDRLRVSVRHHGTLAGDEDDDAGLGLARYMCTVIARLHGGTFKAEESRGEVTYRLDLGGSGPETQ